MPAVQIDGVQLAYVEQGQGQGAPVVLGFLAKHAA
jgi:hypothetical protein